MSVSREQANEAAAKARQKEGKTKPNGPGGPQMQFPPLQTAAEFVADYVPQRPLLRAWDMKAGWFYSFTAPPGGGKTSIALAEAFFLAMEGKRVVYLAGENAEDVRTRTMLMQFQLGLAELPATLHFIAATFNLHNGYEYIRAKVKALGGADAIFVDTSPSYHVASGADDENDNVEQIRWALFLRSLTSLDGRPTLVALCHPIKRPLGIEDCLPRGGGGYLGQVDGNYASWLTSENGDDIFFEFRWIGKFRGNFEPLTYHVQRATCPKLLDADKQQFKSVWCRRGDERQQEQAATHQTEDEDAVLIVMADYPGKSLAAWARLLGWLTNSGGDNKQRVERVLRRMQKHRLVRKGRGDRWQLLGAGKTEAKRAAEKVRNEAV